LNSLRTHTGLRWKTFTLTNSPMRAKRLEQRLKTLLQRSILPTST